MCERERKRDRQRERERERERELTSVESGLQSNLSLKSDAYRIVKKVSS